MDLVIKELTQKAKDFKHWEKLSLMRGNNRQADQYGKNAKEYERAIEILRDSQKVSTCSRQSNIPVVIKSVCVHPYEKVYQSDTECYCEICGHDFTEQTVL